MAGLRESIPQEMDANRKPAARVIPKFLGRDVYLDANTTITVKPGAGFAVVRGMATGGYVATGYTGGAGAGGAYCESYFSLKPSVTVMAIEVSSQYGRTQVLYDGKVRLRAMPGLPGYNNAGNPAPLSELIGTFRREGSKGQYTVGGGFVPTARGGYAADDSSYPGNYRLFRIPLDTMAPNYNGIKHLFGWGAARLQNQQINSAGPGILIIEWWTSDPRKG